MSTAVLKYFKPATRNALIPSRLHSTTGLPASTFQLVRGLVIYLTLTLSLTHMIRSLKAKGTALIIHL